MLAFMLAAQLLAQAGSSASCPAESPRVVVPAVAPVVADDSIHPTNRRVRFMIDLGSDGRERRVAVIESSGDSTFDNAALESVKNMKFAPPSQNCLSTSFVAPQEFNVPLISLVTPPPAGSTGPMLAPATFTPAPSICTAPFPAITAIDIPAKREAAGTVAVDVGLSAAATVTSVRLAKSSGNTKTDYAATSAARSAQYKFNVAAGCAPKPTTYRLELTYH